MNILVVEDELLTRKSLVKILRHLGYEHVVEASNGTEALPILDRVRPELIIADIRMPGMDGLQLLDEVRRRALPSVYIIVSGFDCFEYAQTALTLGAFSYLLKPIDDTKLIHTMRRAEERISLRKHENERTIASSMAAKKYFEFAKRQTLLKLIEDESLFDEEISNLLKETDLTFTHNGFIVAVIRMVEPPEEMKMKPFTGADETLFLFGIENIASEILSGSNIKPFSFHKEKKVVLLLNLPSEISKNQLQSAMNLLARSIETYIKIPIAIGVGAQTNDLHQLHHSYLTACHASMRRTVLNSMQVVYHEDSAGNEAAVRAIDPITEQRLLYSLENGDSEAFLQMFRSLYSDNDLTVSQYAKLNFQVAFLIFKLLSQLDVNAHDFLGSELKLYKQLNQCSNHSSLMNLYTRIIQDCAEHITQSKKPWNEAIMMKAMTYIQDNYNRNISLNSVAELVHMSPAYFSKQFKQKYGQNFIEFIIVYRVKRARDLLKTGDYTVSDVAALVGFNDEKHFIRTFKKITGVTPGQCRKGLRTDTE